MYLVLNYLFNLLIDVVIDMMMMILFDYIERPVRC